MILLDYNAIAISNVVTQKLDIDENLIRHMILNSIRMYRSKHKEKYGEIVVCTDGKYNWRRDIFTQYKFKRKDARKQSSMDWNELFRITNMVLEEIKENFGYKVVEVDEVEADDIIAALCRYSNEEFGKYEPILIVSSDKDFVQLQTYGNVDQYSPIKKKFIKEQNPRAQLQELIMRGDTSDGVPNVLSNDDVFVEGIRQTPLSQKKMSDMINRLDEVTINLTNVPEWYRNYLRNRKLIDLSQTPEPLVEKIISNYENQDPWQNKGKVFPYLVEKKCRLLLESVGDFV